MSISNEKQIQHQKAKEEKRKTDKAILQNLPFLSVIELKVNVTFGKIQFKAGDKAMKIKNGSRYLWVGMKGKRYCFHYRLLTCDQIKVLEILTQKNDND